MSVAPEFPPLVDIPERARLADGRRSASRRHLRLVAEYPSDVAAAPPVECPQRPAIDGASRVGRSASSIRRDEAAGALPLTLTARGVRVVCLAVALLGVGMLAVAYLSWPSATPVSSMAPSTVTVQSGDTLWSIAHDVAPHRDPRAVVDDLIARNHLAGASLTPGQTLRVT